MRVISSTLDQEFHDDEVQQDQPVGTSERLEVTTPTESKTTTATDVMNNVNNLGSIFLSINTIDSSPVLIGIWSVHNGSLTIAVLEQPTCFSRRVRGDKICR